MELYKALQAIHTKIQQNRDNAVYAGDREMQRAVLENQERLSESILIIGAMLQAVIEKEIEIQLMPDVKEGKH